jgi:glucose/mannose-6-phosphate isomerase
MRQTILEFPKQFRVGLQAAKNVKVEGKFDALLISGMGGSALPGEILGIWLRSYKIGLPLYINRDYGLPDTVDERSLLVFISYSGNTEEILTTFKEAQKKNLKIVAITSGGKLAKLCQKSKIPFARIPKGFQPRMALGMQFAALVKILVNCGIIKNNLENILGLENKLLPKELELKGKNLAKKLKGKIPVIYASDRLKSLAQIWKIKFNENSKTIALTNYFPELNHNEITGFLNSQGKFQIIILEDPSDHLRILKRMKLTSKILKSKGVIVQTIQIKGKDILDKTFSNLLLADWASYYLALEKRLDPTPVKLQEEFKKRLK